MNDSPRVRQSLLSATIFIAVCTMTFAQDAVVTPEQARILSTGPTPSQTPAESQVTAGSGPEMTGSPRRFQYSFGVTVRGVYDDNTNISSFNPISDYYVAVEPSIFLGFGGDDSQGASSLSFTYRPSLFIFAERSDRDTVQHIIQLQGQHRFGRLALSLTQNVQILDGTDLNSISDPTGHEANIDVGQPARHEVYITQLGTSYDLSSKTFLSASGSYSSDNYETGQITSESFSGNLFFNYNYSAKLVVGLGGTGGFNTVEMGSPDQTFEQANARISYSATAKASLNASAGAEFRQFTTGGRGQYISPVFDISASYQPFDGTSISLAGNRRTLNSAVLGGEDYASTNISVNVQQRFLRKTSIGLSAGYTNSDYFSTIAGLSATRQDNYYYIQPSLDLTIVRFWSAGAYYLHRQNSSSFAFFEFEDNQIGIRSTITF